MKWTNGQWTNEKAAMIDKGQRSPDRKAEWGNIIIGSSSNRTLPNVYLNRLLKLKTKAKKELKNKL